MAFIGHGRSGLRGCLGGKSPQGLSKNRSIWVLHDHNIDVRNMSLYLLQELLRARAISPFPGLLLLSNFFIKRILRQWDLRQIPVWGSQKKGNFIKSHPPLYESHQPGLIDNSGCRALSIIETKVIVSMHNLHQFLLHGPEFRVLGRDDT